MGDMEVIKEQITNHFNKELLCYLSFYPWLVFPITICHVILPIILLQKKKNTILGECQCQLSVHLSDSNRKFSKVTSKSEGTISQRSCFPC
jgi:hypothetical protein